MRTTDTDIRSFNLNINKMTNVKVTVELSDSTQQKLRISDVSNSNNQCNHPKTQIWQWSDHWFCCKCWHREQGKYAGSVFDK